MSDRTINFGESETEATYQIQDTDGAAGGGNFVIAKDTNASTVLLQYNPTSGAFEYAADIDLSGSNLTVDDVSATTASVSTAPSAADDVARQTELDGKADATHATTHETGGSDTLDSGSLTADSEFQLFTTTSDPAADVGSIWYRSDLD